MWILWFLLPSVMAPHVHVDNVSVQPVYQPRLREMRPFTPFLI